MFKNHARILILLCCYFTLSKACHSFNNVKITANLKNGSKLATEFSGCLERRAFEHLGNPQLEEVFIRGQSIPYLYRDSIRHLVKLKKVSISECDLAEIEPQLFRNVPILEQVYINNCSLTSIKKGIFSNITTIHQLRFIGNQIRTIEDEAFAKMTSLKKIDISYNSLIEFKATWFDRDDKLEHINFKHNKITQLLRNGFENLGELKYLNFDFNEIATIESEAFKGLEVLNYLGLRHNKLTVISPDIFEDGLIIYSFNIGANHLNFLSKQLRDKIAIEELLHDGNPWSCLCMDEIFHWLSSINGTAHVSDDCERSDVPACAFPSALSDDCVESPDESLTRIYIRQLRGAVPAVDVECYGD